MRRMPTAARLAARLAAGRAAVVLSLLTGVPSGCASRAPAPLNAAVGASPRDALLRAEAAFRARDWTAARDALERAQLDAATPAEMADVTSLRAALAAYEGDLATAARLVGWISCCGSPCTATRAPTRA